MQKRRAETVIDRPADVVWVKDPRFRRHHMDSKHRVMCP